MSRYFTSPPPVYARNWANGQNLVESTKIERPIIASKKVHRNEKKERRKEKKQKSIEKTIEHLYLPKKQVCDESEQLERSCLTEEHEKYLSDGSQDSKKRRREASPSVDSNIKATPVTGNGNLLRIRFVFKKPKVAEVVAPQVPQEDRICSTSGSDRPSKISSSVSSHDEHLVPASIESDKTAILSESKKKKKHEKSKESRYSSLFDEPAPPSFSMEEDSSNSDDDWLLGARRQEKTSTKSTMNADMVMKSGESCFPSSQFLPEAGIFSLPYTVLF